MICPAEDLEFSLNRFSNRTQDILTPFYNVEKDLNEETGLLAAICLKFTLFKGAYATILIRELSKHPTDFDTQIALSRIYEAIDLN